MTVGELVRGRGTPMSSVELEEWKTYFKIVASESPSGGSGGSGNGGGNGRDLTQ